MRFIFSALQRNRELKALCSSHSTAFETKATRSEAAQLLRRWDRGEDRLSPSVATPTLHRLTKEQACVAAGIGVSTLADWLERYPELAERVGQAREQGRQKALAGIKRAGEDGDWRALEVFLRFSFPADYRRADTRIVVTATAQQALAVYCRPQYPSIWITISVGDLRKRRRTCGQTTVLRLLRS